MGGWLVDNIIDGVIDWFAKTILGALEALWRLLSDTVFVSPDVTRLPQVTAFAATSLNIVNVCYVLAFLWVGILVLARGTVQSQLGPGELIPRLIIGLVAANVAIPLCSALIVLANALTAALTSQGITAPGSMRQLRTITISALKPQSGANPVSFLLLLIGLFIAVLVAMLVVQWVIRLGVLVVAVGIAPIALALHGTPQTEPAAKLWWRTMLGTLGTVVIQAVAMHTALSIFLNPESNLPALGMPAPDGDAGTVMNLFVVVCLLWGLVQVPKMMRRYITGSRPSAIGTVLRVMLVQQLTHGVSRVLSAGRRRPVNAVGPGSGFSGTAGTGRASQPWPVTAGGTGRFAARQPAPARVPRGATPRRPAPVNLPQDLITQPGRSRPAAYASAQQRTGARPGSAYPTGRATRTPRPYTRDELAGGVDLYTRAMKTRAARTGRKATP